MNEYKFIVKVAYLYFIDITKLLKKRAENELSPYF